MNKWHKNTNCSHADISDQKYSHQQWQEFVTETGEYEFVKEFWQLTSRQSFLLLAWKVNAVAAVGAARSIAADRQAAASFPQAVIWSHRSCYIVTWLRFWPTTHRKKRQIDVFTWNCITLSLWVDAGRQELQRSFLLLTAEGGCCRPSGSCTKYRQTDGQLL